MDNLDELLKEFKKREVVQIESPDGAGTYTLTLEESMKNYPVTLYWQGNGLRRHGSTVHSDWGRFSSTYGDQVAWQPYAGDGWAVKDRNWRDWDPAALAAVAIQVIQSGVLLYAQNCGVKVSSTGVVNGRY